MDKLAFVYEITLIQVRMCMCDKFINDNMIIIAWRTLPFVRNIYLKIIFKIYK